MTVEMNGEVGATGWKVWLLIYNEGPQALVELRRKVNEPSELLNLAVGWSAREDKVEIVRQRKGLRIELRKALISPVRRARRGQPLVRHEAWTGGRGAARNAAGEL